MNITESRQTVGYSISPSKGKNAINMHSAGRCSAFPRNIPSGLPILVPILLFPSFSFACSHSLSFYLFVAPIIPLSLASFYPSVSFLLLTGSKHGQDQGQLKITCILLAPLRGINSRGARRSACRAVACVGERQSCLRSTLHDFRSSFNCNCKVRQYSPHHVVAS